MKKQRLTEAEKKEAEALIKELNEKIGGLEEEVTRLTAENKQLGTDLSTEKQKTTQLSTDLQTTTSVKQELEKKVDVASTLNASNITITPIDVKRNGKEKVSSTAKRVDKMVVSFDVANRIIQTGSTDLYVLVIGPDGQPVTATGSTGLFTTREEGDKTYTAKVPVDLETAKTKNVSFNFEPGASFQKGDYKIQIYQNGFLIGQGTRSLKKGGLFS